MVKRTSAPAVSSSVQMIAERLTDLGISKTEFARALSVSPDYVYRILNGRVPFPRVRGTIERMAEILEIDALAFGEYRELDQALSASTRLVWQRMKELGISRDALFDALGGRISRPYFNSILRGDQPFPSNRAYVQLFALALDLPPTAFKEYAAATSTRWSEQEVREAEERFYNLLFDKMLGDQGFSRGRIELELLGRLADGLFPPRERRSPELIAVLGRMGELGMGVAELEKVSGVPSGRLRELLACERVPSERKADFASVRRALRLT